jgi:hypothetical protein
MIRLYQLYQFYLDVNHILQSHLNFVRFITDMQSQTKKVGQCFFANVSLFTISMVTIKIFTQLNFR